MQLSIQGSHVHLLVEVENRKAPSLGMKAFEISADIGHVEAARYRLWTAQVLDPRVRAPTNR